MDLPAEPLPPEPAELEVPQRGLSAPVMIIPVGKIEDSILERIRPHLEEVYRRPTTLHKPLPVPKYAYNPTRGQYHSAAILKRVEALYDDAWDCAIGITDVDLFVPEVPFIFGEADRSTRSAIISLTRLRPEAGPTDNRSEHLLKRLISESIHQLGLIRGLAHCPNNRCVMFYAATNQEIDKRGATMCANCRKRLMDLY
ncbi:MAG: archaemetzincin family Zn-dependent metalloprotease [Myxococcales bacterium]|nr:archaemetzincin family Zn-dependent metalloprotease [Myxococcales bacterium]MCB9647661.1 archaemetzincin family Zn-dependent metalloprotease [Deltaproteobacteria bacterium]